jgi:hypothetical protein
MTSTQYFSDCIAQAFQTACEKGWHDGEQLPMTSRQEIAVKLALIHAELTEAYDEWTADLQRVTPAVKVELADVAIRLFDLMGAVGVAKFPAVTEFVAQCGSFEAMLLDIHSHVSSAVECLREADLQFPEVLHWKLAIVAMRLFTVCDGMGIDLRPSVAEKMEKNKGRPHRHGGKLL